MVPTMTDEKPAATDTGASASTETAAPAAQEHSVMNLPLDVFVKGGTTSGKHDRWMQAQLEDERRRRAEDDREKALAREHAFSKGSRTEVAGLFNHEFTDHPEIGKAYIPLAYMSKNRKEVDFYGMGDIIMVQDPKIPDELALLIFCPRCLSNGTPASHSIIQIRQSNRPWHLDRKTAGKLFVDPDGEAKHSAGEVVDGEPFTCGRCEWKAVIDKNRVITL